MSTELFWLMATLLMTSLFWVPYILDRLIVRGMATALLDRQAETGHPHSAWAQRAIAAHKNAVENLVIFAPAALAAHVLGVSTEATRLAVMVYFFARLVHFLVYTAGIPLFRTLTFAVSWAASLTVILTVLQAGP